MLEIKNIVKQYAQHRALDDVSIHIPKGKIFGLLGPNGAGKTSLIRIINQITAPDQGEIIFDGERLNASHIEKIGYLPEERGLYKKMEIGEQMLYLSQLKGLTKAEATKRIKYWFEKMDMQTWWNKKVEDLSKGMQQKVQFVTTVVHQPDLIILDEPFSGFDPVNANIIKEEILELNRKGATIIFSTHRMESVEELCDQIALIHKSKKILDGEVEEIKQRFKSHAYHFTLKGSLELTSQPPSHEMEIIKQLKNKGNTSFSVKIKDDSSVNTALNYFMNQGEILEFKEIVPTINDIFIDQVTTNSKPNTSTDHE